MIDNTKNNSALLLGVGLDNRDEHRRITRGDNFYLVGGYTSRLKKLHNFLVSHCCAYIICTLFIFPVIIT